MTVPHGLKIQEHVDKRLAVVILSLGYCDFFAPVCLRLSYFIVVVEYMLRLLQLSFDRELIVQDSNCIICPVFFFTIGNSNAADREISVAMCEFIYSLEVSHWKVFLGRAY